MKKYRIRALLALTACSPETITEIEYRDRVVEVEVENTDRIEELQSQLEALQSTNSLLNSQVNELQYQLTLHHPQSAVDSLANIITILSDRIEEYETDESFVSPYGGLFSETFQDLNLNVFDSFLLSDIEFLVTSKSTITCCVGREYHSMTVIGRYNEGELRLYFEYDHDNGTLEVVNLNYDTPDSSSVSSGGQEFRRLFEFEYQFVDAILSNIESAKLDINN